MSLNQFLEEVETHYRKCGFSQENQSELKTTIRTESTDRLLSVHKEVKDPDGETAAFTIDKELSKLLGHFGACAKIPTSNSALPNVDGVIAFAFGYRLPDRSNKDPRTREPGQNNAELARIADELARDLQVPLFVQFEIARAISGFPRQHRREFQTREQDISTKTVIDQLWHSSISSFNRLAVVAHRHHTERCIRVLKSQFGIIGVPSPVTYDGYDPEEAQPRLKNANLYIVSDFISTAVMA